MGMDYHQQHQQQQQMQYRQQQQQQQQYDQRQHHYHYQLQQQQQAQQQHQYQHHQQQYQYSPAPMNTASYTALQAPSAPDASSVVESMPAYMERPQMYNRPRRLSNNSTASTATTNSVAFSSDSRLRSSSWSSQTSFESMPPGFANYQLQSHHASMYASRQRPANMPIKPYRRRAKPGEIFAALPGEVLELILEELKQLHLKPGSSSCATCWMRDCCSLALTNRKWLKFARVALYEDICLVGADALAMKKRYKLSHSAARLVLLRRTLRTQPRIAVIVRSLGVPAMPSASAMPTEEYLDLVASLVMSCPNLERLPGLHPTFNHSFSRFFHALSTRQRLKEMTWVLESSPLQRQRVRTAGNQLLQSAPGDLQLQQSEAFLEHHANWQNLATLAIHCRPGATLSPEVLVTDTLLCLPALQHLHLSYLPATSFNDNSLLALPPLKSLTLSHLNGITSAGLSAFATRCANAKSITTLHLRHLAVDSLPALARLFSNLPSLSSFALVQPFNPVMPSDEFVWLFPYLASASLRQLHWDIPYLASRASPADMILAKSIAAGGFPSLRSLRTPNDPEGIFQAVCRPRERADCPADRYRDPAAKAVLQQHHQGHVRNGSGGISAPASSAATTPGEKLQPLSVRVSGTLLPRRNSDLLHARLAAQSRLETARKFPRYAVMVNDEDGSLVETVGIGAFIGTVESKIEYLLTPDEGGGTDDGGGLIGLTELLGEKTYGYGYGTSAGSSGDDSGSRDGDRERRSEDGDSIRIVDGCTGRWNAGTSQIMDKKDRERWWHAERPRIARVSL
jgi:hypothetical protein